MRIGYLSSRFENSLLWHVKSRPNLQELLNEVEGPIYLLLTAQTRQTAFGPKVKRTVTASCFNREGRVCELSIAMPEILSFDDKSINQFAAWANKQEDEAKPITTFVRTNRRPAPARTRPCIRSRLQPKPEPQKIATKTCWKIMAGGL